VYVSITPQIIPELILRGCSPVMQEDWGRRGSPTRQVLPEPALPTSRSAAQGLSPLSDPPLLKALGPFAVSEQWANDDRAETEFCASCETGEESGETHPPPTSTKTL